MGTCNIKKLPSCEDAGITRIHRLWGNPSHLDFVASALREKYGVDQLVVLVCKRNAGTFTYDGIEVGAERVAKEIEEQLEELAHEGYHIKKLSMVGYSLGGLVARYAVGLLYHKGWFDRIKPINFTTFATPHLGVRTPVLGYRNQIWNVLGSRTVSTSGRQLFTVDSFRETARPLLSIMADPDSIFIHALSQFERRSLYTNIVNDRSAVYYTTSISRTDPYAQLDQLQLNFVKDYDPVILDSEQPYSLRQENDPPSFYGRLVKSSGTVVKRLPLFVALALVIPLASVAFLINSGVQTMRSRQRIRLHESGLHRQGFGGYRIPFMVQDMRQAVEDAFENTNSAPRQDYLPDGYEATANRDVADIKASEESLPESLAESSVSSDSEKLALVKSTSKPERQSEFPTLALTTAQFAMIKALDDVGFRKYPVYIHKTTHSHAAIIVRRKAAAYDEGSLVVQHWLNEEFQI